MNSQKKNMATLPTLVWIVLMSIVLAHALQATIFGFNITGWAWVIPFTYSLLILIKKSGSVSFPIKLWAPWMLAAVIYPFYTEYAFFQRTVQILCPIFIGMAISSESINEEQLQEFIRRCRQLAVALMFSALFKTGTIASGTLPETTGLAPQVMTAAVLCCIFAVLYTQGETRYLYWWAAMAAMPVFAVTRTAVVAAGITLPLAPGRFSPGNRIIIAIFVVAAAYSVFYESRFQKKSFSSEKGEMSDVMSADFQSTGRSAMWEQFRYRIKNEPWVGYGVGAGEKFSREITMGISGYPHNDWLLTTYDYGYVGSVLYALTLLATALHAFREGTRTAGISRSFFYAGAITFIPYAILMYTDNIMVYASFYGNLQYCILGLAYASVRTEK